MSSGQGVFQLLDFQMALLTRVGTLFPQSLLISLSLQQSSYYANIILSLLPYFSPKTS
jgi:hypothetical protein